MSTQAVGAKRYMHFSDSCFEGRGACIGLVARRVAKLPAVILELGLLPFGELQQTLLVIDTTDFDLVGKARVDKARGVENTLVRGSKHQRRCPVSGSIPRARCMPLARAACACSCCMLVLVLQAIAWHYVMRYVGWGAGGPHLKCLRNSRPLMPAPSPQPGIWFG